MKFGTSFSVCAAAVAILYGVLFSVTYPLVEISAGIVALCALFGVLTCFAVVGLWKLAFGGKA
jgi:hypothetical protein